MLEALRGVSPASEAMSDETLERNRAEKALITKTPTHTQYKGVKNYSDKNGNDVTKAIHRGRKTFAFWTLVCLLLVLAVGNLVLTFTILAVLRLGHGLESMEFLPAQRALKLFGRAELQHVYKRDGRLESFQGEPLAVTSLGGAVVFSLQTRLSRADARLAVNASGVFIRGVSSLELRDPATGEVVLTTSGARGGAQCTVPDAVHNLHARLISTHRVSAPVDEDLVLHSDSSTFLRGAEGTRMESKELFWSADQDIYIKSINGSIVLSGKEGVYLDVRYLPIAAPERSAAPGAAGPRAAPGAAGPRAGAAGPRAGAAGARAAPGAAGPRAAPGAAGPRAGAAGPRAAPGAAGPRAAPGAAGPRAGAAGPRAGAAGLTGQFKLCVCMPQGKLFKIAVPSGQRVSCSHVNMTGDLNPCL